MSWKRTNISVWFQSAEAVKYLDSIIITGEDREPSLPHEHAWKYNTTSNSLDRYFKMNPPVREHVSFLIPETFCKLKNKK